MRVDSLGSNEYLSLINIIDLAQEELNMRVDSLGSNEYLWSSLGGYCFYNDSNWTPTSIPRKVEFLLILGLFKFAWMFGLDFAYDSFWVIKGTNIWSPELSSG